ncbi:pilus assembly protein PilM [Patescibacteria group bacterium]|nr:pilus assembly protein PilM [Patescibacteria group bacterium]MBU1472426.1 pilus assembly protein PilM [Patescibacteria group bacterium]MBU2460241.1 pilus assembly protein PilM [Patescibacteria group bacterium]MBU2544554.1 pilus assembly protein PilM [Patescibacteria group bacterium]
MKSLLGLDIGSHSIKLIEIEQDSKGPILRAAGSIPALTKELSSNLPADQQAVALAIQKLIKDAGAKSDQVNIALPEAQVFTRVIEVPQLSDRELSSAIQWEAEQYIPLPLDQVNLDYSVLRDSRETGTNKMDVLLVAAPKVLLDKYLTFLELAELTPVAAETEIIASTRALARATSDIKATMIASIGAKTTDLAILRNGILVFTRSISAGGEAISRSLVQGFDFSPGQAEEYKRTYGLQSDKLEGKIVATVKPIMDTIINEMKRAIAFFQEKYKEERVGAIILSGGSAKLPGMIVYVAESMGIETQLANPWVGIRRESRFQVLDKEGPVFGVAVGLALRE